MTRSPIYIAGPMRGKPRFNFDAFFEAEHALCQQGWGPINPARMDLEVEFDPDGPPPTVQFLHEAMRRDVEAIMNEAEAMAMLPGWEKSTGAQAEYWLARWKHIPIYSYPSMKLVEEEDVLEEALRITQGARQEEYGPPQQDFTRTAAIWSAMKGVEFCAADVAMFMIAVKLSREIHSSKRDNAVDIAGYARCLALCQQDAGS